MQNINKLKTVRHTLSLAWKIALHKSVFWPLLGIGLITIAFVNPTGNFPLNDDWSYAQYVQELLETKRFTSDLSALAFAQTFWGAFFSSLFGFSFSVLRVSTLVLALVALWATARTAQEAGLSRVIAVFCSLIVLSNPIFLNLAYTYMTDVPFLAPLVLAGFFYLTAIKSHKAWPLLVGSVFAVVAASNRQFGVIIAVAFLVTEFYFHLRGVRRPRITHLIAFISPWVAGFIIYKYFPGFVDRPPSDLQISSISPLELLRKMLWTVSIGLIYMGLFLFPFATARLFQLLRGAVKWKTGQKLAFAVFFTVIFLGIEPFSGGGFWNRSMPLLPNILHDLGAGPLTLRDTLLADMPGPIKIGDWWCIITFLSIVSASIFAVDVILSFWSDLFGRDGKAQSGQLSASWDLQSQQRIFLFLWGALYAFAPYFLVMKVPFDRYLLPALPAFAILYAYQFRHDWIRHVRMTALIPCILFYIFSIACVQDYMAWNRARWDAIEFLRNDLKVHPFRIDGGYEYNALYTRDEYISRTGAGPMEWGPMGFWVLDDSYSVSFNPRAGSKIIHRVAYFSWLGMTQRQIFVLKREGAF